MLIPALKILAPPTNAAALREFYLFAAQRRDLIYEMTRRDVLDRYAGQVLGGIWVVANPLLIMGVYVFAFTVLFAGRLSAKGDTAEYVAYILSAMAPWVAFSEAVGRAPTAVVANTNLVKQIVFPNEILPLKVTLGALPTLFVSLFVALFVTLLSGHAQPLGWLLLPIPILCQVLMTTGIAYFLASVGVFLKDVKDVVGLLLSIGFFLLPIIYAPGIAPHGLELVFYINPVSYVLWCFRDAMFYGGIVDPYIWLLAVVFSVLIFVVGYRVYRMLQPTFGNAL